MRVIAANSGAFPGLASKAEKTCSAFWSSPFATSAKPYSRFTFPAVNHWGSISKAFEYACSAAGNVYMYVYAAVRVVALGMPERTGWTHRICDVGRHFWRTALVLPH